MDQTNTQNNLTMEVSENLNCKNCGKTEDKNFVVTEQMDNTSVSDGQEDQCTLRRSSRKKRKDNINVSVDYNLRDITLVNRVQSERKRKEPKQPKPKVKPPPLSKYRRKAANARERGRMVDINIAFEQLRNVLPDIEAGNATKLTKITTLRLAMNYISALRHTLGYEDDLNSDASSLRSSSLSSGDEQCLSPSDGELLSPEDSDLLESDNADDIIAANIDLVHLDLDSNSDLLLT